MLRQVLSRGNALVSSSRVAPLAVFSRGFAQREPLKLYSPSGMIAHSIQEACTEDKVNMREVSKLLNLWVTAYNENEDVRRFLEDTDMDPAEKQKKLDTELFKECGLVGKESHKEVAREVISIAIEDGTVGTTLPEVVTDFEQLVLDQYGEVKCVVTSAEALTPAQKKKIEKKLAGCVDKDQTCIIEYNVDPEIIGGLTLQVGSKFQDLSVRYGLVQGEEALRSMTA